MFTFGYGTKIREVQVFGGGNPLCGAYVDWLVSALEKTGRGVEAFRWAFIDVTK